MKADNLLGTSLEGRNDHLRSSHFNFMYKLTLVFPLHLPILHKRILLLFTLLTFKTTLAGEDVY